MTARYAYPHTIENGHGERVTFLRRETGPHGDRLEVENTVQPGAGPPMHVHHHQAERIRVVSGRIAFQRPGGPVRYAGPGEVAAFEAGDAHKFWNPDPVPMTGHGWIEPAGNIEYFLSTIFALQRESPSGRVPLLDAAYVLTHFRPEFTLLEIPAPVQRFVFPVLVLVGRLLGRHRKYADAPAPVRR